MSSSRNTPTTARSIARPRSWRGRASRSSGRPWPSGPAMPPPRSGPCGGCCARSCCARRSCSSTRPRRRFSIRVGDGPRRGTSGCSPATIGRGRAARPRRWCTATRRGDYAAALLKGYTGVLQTDGYAGYRSLADPKREGGPATLAFCWAHWRRQFFELARSPPAPIATEALKRIAELYDIEAEIRGKSAAERRAVRQEKTRPLVAALKSWGESTLARLAGGSTLAQALRYGLNHWEGLNRFLDDGRIEIDSNTVERSMRPIALNRKNALFAGSDEGAENWAMLASLIETCKLHGVNPEAYLSDVLTRLVNGWPNRRLADLLPWAWAAAESR